MSRTIHIEVQEPLFVFAKTLSLPDGYTWSDVEAWSVGYGEFTATMADGREFTALVTDGGEAEVVGVTIYAVGEDGAVDWLNVLGSRPLVTDPV